ncbi:Hemerythrin HHE cation binding domain-containing protein [Evansella caseinilytica]|uniref:Hemerythrin HHE cation binding domain-containing protein n=1 Tax=Evansella caseinilytica TaxID=1503961 RepID=A0A1H3SYD4_9BACI|nr:hemerythrin domain-containing protein [Evansella caseinilytica]SDZ43036.1 Hemerythrin HHE cation binding domain-containing protein [Evansella caseinilytica]
MSGPALRKLHSHKSIHDGAVTEGRDIMTLLEDVYKKKQEKHAKIAAAALIEHWETRILAHADAEEEGLYLDIKKQRPDLQETITKLIRDHELIRILVKETKTMLDDSSVTEEVIDRFKAVYVLVQLHSREEENYLPLEHH